MSDLLLGTPAGLFPDSTDQTDRACKQMRYTGAFEQAPQVISRAKGTWEFGMGETPPVDKLG